MHIIYFPTDLAIVIITYLSAIRMVVELLLYSADSIFPVWDPGPSVRVTSSRYHLRLKPKFDLYDHFQSLRRQKRYNRQWKQVKVHPGRINNFTYHSPGVLPKDVPAFRTPWLIHLICLVLGMEIFISKFVRKSIRQ